MLEIFSDKGELRRGMFKLPFYSTGNDRSI